MHMTAINFEAKTSELMKNIEEIFKNPSSAITQFDCGILKKRRNLVPLMQSWYNMNSKVCSCTTLPL